MTATPKCRARGGAAACKDSACPEKRAGMVEFYGAPVYSLPGTSGARFGAAGFVEASSLPPHALAAAEMYVEQMVAEGMADEGETAHDYRYEVRGEALEDFIERYCAGDFAGGCTPQEFAQHHAEVITSFEIEHHAGPRWPVIVDDENPNYIEDGFHRLHDYIRSGAKVIPTMRMRYRG